MIDFSREALLEDLYQEAYMKIATAPKGISKLVSDFSKEDKVLLAEIEKDMFECPPTLKK